MNISDFDYQLTDAHIARTPSQKREDARLFVLGKNIEHKIFKDVPYYLEPGDVLVLNDTKVLPARFFGNRATGGQLEFLFERLLGEKEALFHIKGQRKLHIGEVLHAHEACFTVLEKNNLVRLSCDKPIIDFLHAFGQLALPPYLGRLAKTQDNDTYQTVYAREEGSVAAPTAGLHFTTQLLDTLRAQGVVVATVTLHVGAGTFQDLRHEKVTDNTLHTEYYEINEKTVQAIQHAKATGKKVVAVGTTSVRTLESAAQTGTLIAQKSETSIFIYPGYTFKVVDKLITNFHLPKSSLLMLVCAFGGTNRVLDAYKIAVQNDYKLFSYGDAMLVEPVC